MLLATCFFGLLLAGLTNSYRILVVFPMPSKSHFILGSALSRGLLAAGHDVTMVSPFEIKNPPKGGGKYNKIILRGFAEMASNVVINLFDIEKSSTFMQIPILTDMGIEITKDAIYNPDFQEILKSNDHYDAVIFEQFNLDGIKILHHHFKVPKILFSAVQANRWFNDLVGNPEPPSYSPDLLTDHSVPMSFLDRVENFVFGVTADLYRHFYFYPAQNNLIKGAYKDAPELHSILYNVSLVLVNSHESTTQAVPSVPNMINIGGFHVEPTKPLPKELQEFMDSAKEGVIYFSLGSTLPPSMMPNTTLEVFVKLFGKLKQKVLWKWNKDELPNKPDNIKISKWFPQQDILAHPNCKLFMSQGGYLSITESVYNGVPALVFPVLADQKLNAAQAETLGYGISLPISEVTEETLNEALTDLLNNRKYRDNAKRRAAILHDRIVKPLDTAVYWVEYVIRHKGAPHLRIGGVELPLYQYLMLDVIGFLIFLGVLPYLIYLILKRFVL